MIFRDKSSRLIGGCFPIDEFRRSASRMSTTDIELECAKLAERLSACSFPHTPPSTPERSFNSSSFTRFVSYIDDGFSSESEDEEVGAKCSGRRQFSSDSGISSSSATPTDPNKTSCTDRSAFNRSVKWTSSFRKLIRRVSSKKINTNDS